MTDLTEATFRMVDEAWRRGLTPEPQMTVSEWADKNRILPGANAEPGPWRTSRVPYLGEIMDCLSVSNPIERVVFMKGAQTGGTEAGLNAIGYWIAHAPGLILAVWPSIDMVRRNSRTRIEPLIDGTPAIRSKIAPPRAKEPGNTIGLKEFPGGALIMTGANSATGLRSTPARYLVLDEVDAFPADADDEGDPVALAIQRTVTFRGRRKILMISTPTIAGASRIEKAFAESDQRRYFVRCPHCGEFQTLRWSNVLWPPDELRNAYYACEECGEEIQEADKPAMLAAGEWRSTATGDGLTAGFHLSALYSPFESWGEIAAEHAAVRRDPLRLKPWTNTKLGEPFEDIDTSPIPAEGFLSRLEDWGERIPEGIAAIIAGVDVQDDRLALEIVGWGEGEESWSLGWMELWGDPAKPDVWRNLDRELLRTFDHPKLGPISVACTAIDSGGHNTQTVYDFARERAYRRVWAIKGANRPGTPVWPRRPPKPRKAGAYTPFMVGGDAAKEIIMARLRLVDVGPGFCHFPTGRDADFFLQLQAEKLVKIWRAGVVRRLWKKDPWTRNEALDCRVYAFAALQGMAAGGFRLRDEVKKISALPILTEGKKLSSDKNSIVIRSKWLSR